MLDKRFFLQSAMADKQLQARITELMKSKGLCEIRFDCNLTKEQRRQIREIKEPRGLFSVYALKDYRQEVMSLLRRGSSQIIARLVVLERLLRKDSSRYALLKDPDAVLIYSIVQVGVGVVSFVVP
jgi:hypothetical protein